MYISIYGSIVLRLSPSGLTQPQNRVYTFTLHGLAFLIDPKKSLEICILHMFENVYFCNLSGSYFKCPVLVFIRSVEFIISGMVVRS